MSQTVDLLEVSVLPCSFIKDVMIGAWRVLNEGVEKKEGRVVLGFKVRVSFSWYSISRKLDL